MEYSNLIELIAKSLPADFDIEQIISQVEPDLWRVNPVLACATSLRQRMDWAAYLRNYPDVEKAGMDPVLHFMKYGVFEGRKLFAAKLVPQKNKAQEPPELSIIIVCGNDDDFLRHSLESLTNQSLREIEIIVADMGSSDGSKEMLREMAEIDSRIKILDCAHLRSENLGRKAGARASTGKYVMFVDPRDCYSTKACSIARNAAAKGYDMVCFGGRAVWCGNVAPVQKNAISAMLGNAKGKVYYGVEILDALFINNTISPLVGLKLFSSSLVKEALENTQDAEFPFRHEEYEMLALASRARTALVIDDILCFCPRGSNAPEDAKTRTEWQQELRAPVAAIKEYCAINGLEQYGQILTRKFLSEAVEYWLNECPNDEITDCFNDMAAQYGILALVDFLHVRHGKDWMTVANRFQYYQRRRNTVSVKNVGLYFPVINIGGVESALSVLADALMEKGIEVTLFLRVSTVYGGQLNQKIKIVYLSDHDYWGVKNNSLYQFHEYITRFSIDIMLSQECTNRYQLWEAMILKYLGIPSVLFYHNSFYHTLSHPGIDYNLQQILSVCRCLDKVICVSGYAELFMRVNDIDAEYVHNPVLGAPDSPPPPDICARDCNIVAIGRLSEPVKQMEDCLSIFQHVRKALPDSRLTFIGSFADAAQRRKFDGLIAKKGLSGTVVITGWTKNMAVYLDQSSVMLSTAWTEAFGIALCEAQARGLPVVMYDVPIEPARDNESIIIVPQGDIKGAATEIVSLFKDQARLRRLSAIAMENCKKFDMASCVAKIISCIENIDSCCNLSFYSQADYRAVMRALVYHGTHMPPWLAKK